VSCADTGQAKTTATTRPQRNAKIVFELINPVT
jgi:hypothetical protein